MGIFILLCLYLENERTCSSTKASSSPQEPDGTELPEWWAVFWVSEGCITGLTDPVVAGSATSILQGEGGAHLERAGQRCLREISSFSGPAPQELCDYDSFLSVSGSLHLS